VGALAKARDGLVSLRPDFFSEDEAPPTMSGGFRELDLRAQAQV
jgi:hypothetical protein